MASEALNEWQRRCYALVTEKAALEQQLAQVREEAAMFKAAHEDHLSREASTYTENERLRLFMDPNKSGAEALLAANREIESLHHQLAASDRQQQKLQAALNSSLAMQQEDEQTIGDARALIIDYIAAITRRAPELAAEPASALFSLDDQVATHLYQQMLTWLEKHPAPEEGGLEDDDDDE